MPSSTQKHKNLLGRDRELHAPVVADTHIMTERNGVLDGYLSVCVIENENELTDVRYS